MDTDRFVALCQDPHYLARLALSMGMTPEEFARRLEEAMEGMDIPRNWGVLYDREHIEGVGGFHASEEDGGTWIECVTPTLGWPTWDGKTRISERILRAQGYKVPEFTGPPCPRCFGAKGGA